MRYAKEVMRAAKKCRAGELTASSGG